MLDFENLQNYRENNRIEAKEALGGLPESIWETYSAFANTDGGIILLGVEEQADKSLRALDLLDPQWLLEDFYAIVNDPDRVSSNILTEQDVQIHRIAGRQIIAINVPPAPKSLRPVRVAQDGRICAFRRCGEGDCRLSEAEIAAMEAGRG